MKTNKSIELVLKHYQSGDLKEAELLCKIIIEKQPANAEALYLLGIISYHLQNYDSAIKYLKRYLRLNTKNADAYLALGMAYQQNGFLDDAITSYRKALNIDPNNSQLYLILGQLLDEKGQLDEAIVCYRKTLEVNPGMVDAYNRLGNTLQEKKEFAEAITFYQKAISINPNDPTAYINIGIAMHNNYNFNDAIIYLQKALSLNPNIEMTYNYMGYSLFCQGKLEEAIKNFKSSLRINPDSPIALTQLGHIFQKQGKVIDADNCYRRALQIQPNDIILFEAFLVNLLYNSRYDAQTIFSEHLDFGKQFEVPLQSIAIFHTNKKIINKKLKIGYVSPDFRNHSVSHFIEPIIYSHNRNQFTVFCYSNVQRKDEVTSRIQNRADQWRNIAGMSDEKALELIRNDDIDILIDLAGHTAKNCMLLFARKPAPVQVTWIGYPATTGLSTIDYKLVDSYTDPAGMTEEFYTEKLLRMPECFLCYLPDKESPDIKRLPALRSDHITFGSFNNFPKASPIVIDLWTKILQAIYKSRLILKSTCFSDKSTSDYVSDIFIKNGISADRIELLPYDPSTRAHLNTYNRIDIGLDTFPYNGTTTTCEAIWMGVPVVTLAGNTHASRVGMSLLSNIGIPELIAKTSDEYISIAVRLANNLRHLQSLRDNLRGIMAKSVLMDENRFIIDLEKLYHTIWKEWCRH
jgi:protein O-GlcNAc transferase